MPQTLRRICRHSVRSTLKSRRENQKQLVILAVKRDSPGWLFANELGRKLVPPRGIAFLTMASKENVHTLLTKIGQQMDLDEVVEFEEDNLWVLAFPGDLVVEIDYVEAQNRIYLAANLGKPAEEREAEFYKLLLQYNYLWEETGGARTALDSEGEVFLVLDLPADLEFTELQACLGNFRQTVPSWRSLLSQTSTGAQERAPAEDPDLSIGGLRI